MGPPQPGAIPGGETPAQHNSVACVAADTTTAATTVRPIHVPDFNLHTSKRSLLCHNLLCNTVTSCRMCVPVSTLQLGQKRAPNFSQQHWLDFCADSPAGQVRQEPCSCCALNNSSIKGKCTE
jgi:hypothetical protein